MKFSTRLLVVASLVTNLTLAVALVRRGGQASARPAAATIAPVARAVPPPLADPETWLRLDAPEPTDLIARLRAEGFPPGVIRAIARQLVEERFRTRLQALRQAEATKPYWRGTGAYGPNAQLAAQRRVLQRETAAQLEQLLGPEAFTLAADELADLQHRYGELPPAKLGQLRKILSDYNDLISEVHEATNDILLPEDRAKLALLQREREADAARLFSPEELIEYELHHSSTANRLLDQLKAFDPTEQEFRALFALNRAIDASHGNPGVLSPDERRARTAALKELAPKIESTLGPARYAEYQQAIDPNYQQVFLLTTRLDLPRAAARQVMAVQKDIQARFAATDTDPSLAPDQRRARLDALHQEATARLTTTLGATGLEAYLSTTGYWLKALQSASKPPAPRP